MAVDKTPIKSFELYDMIRRYPAYRVVGDTGDANTCTPFQFACHEDSLVFFTDMAVTQQHKHAMCEDILDFLGELDEGALEGPVLVKEFKEDPWARAFEAYRVTRDDSVKWLKVHFR